MIMGRPEQLLIGAMDRHWNRAPHALAAGALLAMALAMTGVVLWLTVGGTAWLL
jgi:hypothetical protein